jgi:hypothetical protein
VEITIHHTETITPAGNKAAGIEIEPGLTDAAASGLHSALAEKFEGFGTGREQFAQNVYMTRSDIEGTVLLVQPNRRRDLTPGQVAMAVAAAIDPCGRHTIKFEPPLDGQGPLTH